MTLDCETCGYHTNDFSNYRKHKLTKKHASLNKTNIAFTFPCETCGYKTNDGSDFKSHRKNKKHANGEFYVERGPTKYHADRGYRARECVLKKAQSPKQFSISSLMISWISTYLHGLDSWNSAQKIRTENQRRKSAQSHPQHNSAYHLRWYPQFFKYSKF